MNEDMTASPVESDKDYEAEVTTIIEAGSSFQGTTPSWLEYKKDAYLLYDRPRVSLEKLVNMRRTDGQARFLSNLMTLPIKLALQQGQWIAPPGGDAEEEVEFANLMWSASPAQGGMTTSSSHVISQMLLAITDGHAPFELVTHVPNKGPLKGKWTLRKMAYRDPRTTTLLQDSRGGYAGFRQQILVPKDANGFGGFKDVSLSPKKTALFTVNDHENPLYGVSYFESSYPHYESKMKWYYMSEMAGQFAAVPGRIGTVPKGAKPNDVVAFKRALENFYFNTSMIMKDGYAVTPFNNASAFDFLKYIDHCNSMMSKSVLAAFADGDQRTVLIENSTQDASADLFLLAAETIANNFADVLTNHVMPKYISANFKSTDKFPIFKPGPLSDSARRKIESIFEKVAVSGILNTTPEFVRELEKHVSRDLGLDVDYEDIEAREEEAAIQQAEQAELMAATAQQESLEEERAAEGGVPNAPGAGEPQTNSTRTPPQDKGKVPPEANSGVSLSEDDFYRAVDDMVMMSQRVLTEHSPVEHAVDEGL